LLAGFEPAARFLTIELLHDCGVGRHWLP
jgi:hypothetical protein